MITRDNYEEFFLQYVDNELSVAEKQQVERFVAENPDLQEEWESLQQCRIKPDHDLVFDNKGSLFRPETSFMQEETPDSGTDFSTGPGRSLGPVSDGNYAAYLLYYVDGELDEATSKAVIDFGNRHPERLQELMLLQKTVSSPDPSIIFGHKETLYRKEHDGKVLRLSWLRIAAAAVIIIAAGTYLLYSGRNASRTALPAAGNSLSGTAGQKTTNTTPTVTPGIASTLNNKGQARPAVTEDNAGSGEKAGTVELAAAPGKASQRSLPVDRTARGQRGTALRKGGRHPGNPIITKAGSNDAETNNTGLTYTPPPARVKVTREGIAGKGNIRSSPVAKDQLIAVNQEIVISRENADFATQALMNGSTTYDTEESIAIQSSSRGKSKLRGIFRKVSRVFEKTANLDDSGEKRGILIGSFQFAVK